MSVLSVTTLELHKRVLEHGGVMVRHGAKHDVYSGPLGTFTIPNGKRKPVTGAIVRSAAHCLGTTIQDLLGT